MDKVTILDSFLLMIQEITSLIFSKPILPCFNLLFTEGQLNCISIFVILPNKSFPMPLEITKVLLCFIGVTCSQPLIVLDCPALYAVTQAFYPILIFRHGIEGYDLLILRFSTACLHYRCYKFKHKGWISQQRWPKRVNEVNYEPLNM
uniref:Uncharacterized protein n=1 Tax=Opuntia streptacantha TaxID=393608 RepID=A0A7C9AAX6_OPUST